MSIGLASAAKIQQWSEKILPNGKILGEVTNANTLHYKTFKPTKGGLFCERIFGPLKDFECNCGIRKRPTIEESEKILDHLDTKRKFCEICDVEYTWSVIRRYQLGYIQLTAPMSHLWYLKANPSYLSILLDVKRKKLESIIYCTETTTLENIWKSIHTYGFENSPSFIYLSWKEILEKEQNSKRKLETTILQSKKKIFNQVKKQKKILPTRFKDWSITNRLNNLKLTSVHENLLNRKEKDLNLSISNDLHLETNSFLNLKNKTQHKFQKLLIPFLWKKSWHTLLKRIYFQSLMQNCSIWKSFWSSYFKKRKKIQLKDIKDKQIKTVFKIQGLVLSENQQILTHFFSMSQDCDWPRKNNYRKPISNQKINQSFVSNALSFPNFLTKNKIFNPFLIEKSLDADLKSFVNFNIPNSFSGNKEKIELVSRFMFPKSALNAQIYLTIQHIGPILQNYGLFYFVKFLERNKRFGKLSPNWMKILKSEIKSEFSLKLVSELWTEFRELQNLLLFYLTRNQIKTQVNLLINVRKIHFFCFLQSSQQLNFLTFSLFTIFKTNHLRTIHNLKLFRLFKRDKNFKYFWNIWKNVHLKRFLFINNVFSLNHSTIKLPNKQKPFIPFRFGSQKSIFYTQKEQFKRLRFNLNTVNTLDCKSLFPNSRMFKHPTWSKLINNIYCLSYMYTWDLDRDWKYFLYYASGPSNFMDFQIPYYRHRTFNLSELTLSNSLTGAGLVQRLLLDFQPAELKKISKQHQILLPKIRKKIRQLKSYQGKALKSQLSEIEKLLKKRDHIMRRLKVLRQLLRKNTDPGSMILSRLPVLPPDLRPILKLEDQIAASDLNTLYQRIIFRNDRLKKFLKDPAISQSFESKYAQRLLQEAVDNLIQNGKGNVKPETNSRGQPLKSLSEILKGKQGRFRQYLLGKRVDYSGRSVIVVGPKLQLHQCGLPKEMALELFLPFLIKRILHYKLSATIIGAKTLIKTQTPIVWDLLREVMQNHPVLLNRAPTLHRLGIQAFQPKLIEGRAILIHPLVCPAFNADFDGDQMAVHVPLTIEARIEAWKLMFSRNNLISPATGEPIVLPSQDMVLGCYYLTTEKYKFQKSQQRKLKKQKCKKHSFYHLKASNFLSSEFLPSNFSFTNFNQVLQAYQLNYITSHTSIWLKWNGSIETKFQRCEPIELQINLNGSYEEVQPSLYRRFNPTLICLHQFIQTTPGRVFFNQLVQNYLKPHKY